MENEIISMVHFLRWFLIPVTFFNFGVALVYLYREFLR